MLIQTGIIRKHFIQETVIGSFISILFNLSFTYSLVEADIPDMIQ